MNAKYQSPIIEFSGIPVDRCLWRKNGRIVNLYSEKYDLIGEKAVGDCSVRLIDISDNGD